MLMRLIQYYNCDILIYMLTGKITQLVSPWCRQLHMNGCKILNHNCSHGDPSNMSTRMKRVKRALCTTAWIVNVWARQLIRALTLFMLITRLWMDILKCPRQTKFRRQTWFSCFNACGCHLHLFMKSTPRTKSVAGRVGFVLHSSKWCSSQS